MAQPWDKGERIIDNYVGYKLIKQHYLHSNTNNFMTIIQREANILKEGHINAELLELREHLITLIKECNFRVNVFYKDLGILAQDSISSDGKNYNPAGANYFSKHYLMDKAFNQASSIEGNEKYASSNLINGINSKDSDEKIILSIINSQDSINALSKSMTNAFLDSKNIVVEMDEPTKKFFQAIERNFEKEYMPKLIEASSEISFGAIETFMNNFFVKNATNCSFKIQTDNKNIKKALSANSDGMSEFREVMRDAFGIENFSGYRKKDAEKLKQAIYRKLVYDKLYEKAAQDYYDNFLMATYQKIKGKKMHGSKRKKFVRLMVNTMKGYKNLNFILEDDEKQKQKYQAGLRGIVLEFGIYGAFNLTQNYVKDIAHLVGQTTVVREYLSETYEKGKLTQEKKDVSGDSGSDMCFIGNSGEKYYFQLKNNFNDVSQALSYRSQAEIKVSTFLPTALEGQSEDVKDVLKYLLINTAFLKKYGLGKYNGKNTEDLLFKPSEHQIIADYIIFFLTQSYEFLIGYKYKEKIDNVAHLTVGNIAYIFQGKYFIPVAAYFYSALEMLNKVINSKGPAGIGGVILPSMIIEGFPVNNRTFQKQKQNILIKNKYSNYAQRNDEDKPDYKYCENKYPPALVHHGKDFGEQLYNNLKFNRINITLIIKNLEQLFRK